MNKQGWGKAISFLKPIKELSDKSPLWKWREIAEWFYQNNLIQENRIVDNAASVGFSLHARHKRPIEVKTKTRYA